MPMTVTIEVINKGSLNLLREMENLGLINLRTSASLNSEKAIQENKTSYLSFRGCSKNVPGASVDDFLARCREDKEHELAIEKRQKEERERLAKLHP